MPEATSTAKFLKAVRTGKTDITKVLDGLFADPRTLKTDPAFTKLQNSNSLHSSENEWKPDGIRKFLKQKLKEYNPVDVG